MGYKRRQIVVDKKFQMQYFWIWILLGVGLIAIGIGSYFISRELYGSQRQIDPVMIYIVAGMSLFVLLFCTLMGLLSVMMTHRVAGAAWRLQQWIRLVVSGDNQDVRLRKGDYLQDLAVDLNQFKESYIRLRTLGTEAAALLESIQGNASLSEEQRQRLADLCQKIRADQVTVSESTSTAP